MENLVEKDNEATRNMNEISPNSLDQGTIYLLQTLQSLQANQYNIIQLQNQQQQQQLLKPKEKNNRKDDKKAVAQMFEGQSFPFRLWHLINNEYFNDVIHWSNDGNSIVIPSECDFLEKVLKRKVQRIFKTESMKSFVRQLNLYGFHKVQLEKDEAFAYLRVKSKHRWPEAVFRQASFKKDRPDLLDSVKRRCKVKATIAESKYNKEAAQEMFQQYQMAPAFAFENNNRRGLLQHPQIFHPGHEQLANHFPNVLPQSEHSVDLRGTKRKLQFAEEKALNSKKPIHPMHYPPPPFCFYPPNYVNGNCPPHLVPPPGWSMAPGTPGVNPNMFAPYTENGNLIPQSVSYIRKQGGTASSSPSNEKEKTSHENSSASSSNSSDDSRNDDSRSRVVSPLRKFCASLFRPDSMNNTPSKNCEVNVENESSDFID